MEARSIVGIADLSSAEISGLLAKSITLKAQWKEKGNPPLLGGKSIALVFEKPSLRTRVSFEAGMTQVGGHAIYLAGADIQLGVRESVADVAKNLSRWVEGIVARTFAHSTVVELAANASIPVVNALSDREHPCQALADLLTIMEKKGELRGLKLAFVGDGNNVCNSLLLASGRVGAHMAVAFPPGYDPVPGIVAQAREFARETGAQISLSNDPEEAVGGADVIYTDVWTSMGQENQKEERQRAFAAYQVNQALVDLADPDVLVMHCLPAHRGEEITDEVLDGPRSVVLDQAENRLHLQKALLVELLG